jgi:L-2,4-diaminobutyrate decarboxylase
MEANLFINEDNKDYARDIFLQAIDTGLNFKMQKDVRIGDEAGLRPELLIDNMPEIGKPIESVIQEFNERFLPFCYNVSSSQFMGFPDAGNSIAAIYGNITSDLLQQNLINQSFCSPSATFAEISVIRWLREIVGYDNPHDVRDILDTGGIITGGGTTSNAIGILLARENHKPGTMQSGVTIEDDFYLIVPKGIGHYSVKSAQMWVGCGNRLLEVETKGFRYDLKELEKTLNEYKGKIMGLVAYAGDSRTMTVEHFDKVAVLTKSIDPTIWLHADACHGFSLGFSNKLRGKLKGIEQFDSITTDPHKVLNMPYTMSSLLVKDPQKLRTTASLSDLIMQEQFAFGQITPFIGSKPWMSLKLWFAMKNMGRKGFDELITIRHNRAIEFANLITESPDFKLLNKVDINAVAFMYVGDSDSIKVDELNALNQRIHSTMIKEGKYHLHQFSIPDDGMFEKGALLYPLRFMSGNPNIRTADMHSVITYIREIANT